MVAGARGGYAGASVVRSASGPDACVHPAPTTTPPAARPSATAPGTQAPPLTGVFGAPVTFATHAELSSFGFMWGPSDGQFGAIPAAGGKYTFYGSAGAGAACAGSPNTNGTFTFAGTLDHVTSGKGCRQLFGPGAVPAGWTFDRDYAGGGQLVRFSSAGRTGWLMPFHGEYHWKYLANPPSDQCKVGVNGSQVPCFYSSIGLAVSTDDGKTLQVAGQIAQPSQPLSVFKGGGNNMTVGYGSLVVADANGRHLNNPPPDPGQAYFYLFYSDLLPGLLGACAHTNCLAVARAPYAAVVSAALSGDPQRAGLFHKYDGAAPDAWTQPATAWEALGRSQIPVWTANPACDSASDSHTAACSSSQPSSGWPWIRWLNSIKALCSDLICSCAPVLGSMMSSVFRKRVALIWPTLPQR